MADAKDLVLVFIAGLIVGWVAKEITGGIAAKAKQYSNEEVWEFIRDPETGRTRGVRVVRAAKEN